MKNIYTLYLFLILFIIPITLLQNNQENFSNKKIIISDSAQKSLKKEDEDNEDNEKPSKEDKDEQTFILSKDHNYYQFQFKKKEFQIFPSNKSNKPTDIYFFFTSSPNKKDAESYQFQDIDNQNYLFKSIKNTFKLKISMSDSPLKISINNHDQTLEFEKASKGNSTYNILHFKQPCGNIKIENSKITLKTKNKLIKNNPDYITAIFCGFLAFNKINDLHQYSYEKFFSK